MEFRRPSRPCPSPAPSAVTTLSLDQIRVGVGHGNEYTDIPLVCSPPADPHVPIAADASTTVHTVVHFAPRAPRASAETAGSSEEWPRNLIHPGLRSLNTSSEEESVFARSSRDGSLSSLQSLTSSLGSGGHEDEAVRGQPKRVDHKEGKPPKPACTQGSSEGEHLKRCADCGRCTCPECTRRRMLPSCWMCGRRCSCSLENVVEYATCVCCVRGLFYHCSSDDEDTCADRPFSCKQGRCCTRWAAITLLATLLPCMAFYPLAKVCTMGCQHCYDLAARPGCRCKRGVRRRHVAEAHAAEAHAASTSRMVRCEVVEKET